MRYWNLGLRLGGVDVLRVQPTLLDPVHGISVSEKVTVPTFKVMAEVDISNSAHIQDQVRWSYTA
jgi:hypothetical protein